MALSPMRKAFRAGQYLAAPLELSICADRGWVIALPALPHDSSRVSRNFPPGRPEQVIAERAEAGTFDLLVMGAYGHSRMRS